MFVVPSRAVWHGTPEEAEALNAALTAHCSCTFTPAGELESMCIPHKAHRDSQAWLDHMLFVRRLRDKFVLGEFET